MNACMHVWALGYWMHQQSDLAWAWHRMPVMSSLSLIARHSYSAWWWCFRCCWCWCAALHILHNTSLSLTHTRYILLSKPEISVNNGGWFLFRHRICGMCKFCSDLYTFQSLHCAVCVPATCLPRSRGCLWLAGLSCTFRASMKRMLMIGWAVQASQAGETPYRQYCCLLEC